MSKPLQLVATVLAAVLAAELFNAAVAAVLPADAVLVRIEMSERMAMGLRRALESGAPMAGPDVTPLLQRLSVALADDQATTPEDEGR